MITFLVCLALLVTAYFTYGRYLERVCGVSSANPVPSKAKFDGVDYVPMPMWKTFLIQLLNIAGLGPIFGAVLGAAYGPVAFIWITLGGIFFGAMHDFISGVMSVREGGASLPEIIGKYLGREAKVFMMLFSTALMILVGAVFMSQPAELIAAKIPSVDTTPVINGFSLTVLLVMAGILVYYLMATLFPIDKIIGKIYPLFGFALVFMAVGILVVLLFSGKYTIPEMSLHNHIADTDRFPVIPTLFLTIACGAISGFHATQSPLMARCLKSERQTRPVFYGAMISESIIALIWAAVAMAFWNGADGLNEALAANRNNASVIVDIIANKTLGHGIACFVILGVVVAAITSGDTAFRSARLIISDFAGWEQKTLWKRIAVGVPLVGVAVFVILATDFRTLWSYFAWFNQTLSVFTLWAICIYLVRNRKSVWIALVPALVMTYMCSCYLFIAHQLLDLDHTTSYILAGGVTIFILLYFIHAFRIENRNVKASAQTNN